MIIWLSSYPKSGNTWLRSLLSSYFYTNDGSFNFNLLKNIDQFPSAPYFLKYSDLFLKPESTSKFWIKEQIRINKDKKFKDNLFSIAKKDIFDIVGNELAIQKNINLSIQCPNDDSSLLPIHSDTWDGNSPFETVLWLPFVDCYKTKSMFILNAKKYSKFENIYKSKKLISANGLYKNLKSHIEFVKIKQGHFMLFNQNLPHGNVVNKTSETRVSLNCRIKGLFTPYRQKELGSFFKPLIIRPASQIGLKYKFPKK